MFQRFLYLRKKEFLRNPQFVGNLLVTILMAVNYFFFSLMFLIAGIVLPMVITENSESNPFTQFPGGIIETICAYLLFYFIFDLVFRYFFQKFNYLNIKPLLLTNIPKRKIVRQMLGQSMVSIHTLFGYLFFVPFFIVLLIQQPEKLNVLFLAIACLLLVQINNFINLLVN